MNAEFLLVGIYNKPRLRLEEVCHAIGFTKSTAYKLRSLGEFPIPMIGSPLTADIRDVALYLDEQRRKSAAVSRLDIFIEAAAQT